MGARATAARRAHGTIHTRRSVVLRVAGICSPAFARCALCGGGFATQIREHGQHLVHFLRLHWKRGSAVCGNALVGRMDLIDAEMLTTLQDDVFRAPVIERAIALALEELSPGREAERHAQREADLAAIDAEHAALMAAVRRGGDIETLALLVGRLQGLQSRRATLTRPRPLAGRSRYRSWDAGWRRASARSPPTGAACSHGTSRAVVRS